jgi:hypothetical protein
MPSVNGLRLLSCKIRMPRVGAWHLNFEADVTDDGALEALAAGDDGKVRITLEHEGVSFVGTLVRGDQKRAVYQGRAVAGKGGLSTTLPARSYTSALGVKVQQVVSDILREAGEALSDTVEDSVLERRVSRWTRTQGVASHALLKVADAVGMTWRVLRDGTIWIGAATYPEAEVEHMTLDEDWSDGAILVATNDQGGPGPLLLEPGTTFHGQKLELVEHALSGSGFRTTARNTTLGTALDKFLEGIRRDVDYSRGYAAKVTAQNADGTLQIKPDDPKVAGGGLDNVPIRLGVPGTVRVPNGSRCTFQFESGDPSKPYVCAFGAGDLTELRLGAGTELAARADRTDARIAAVESKVNSMVTAINSHVHTGVTTGAGSSGPPAAPQTTMSPGSTTAADKTRIE